MTGKYNQFHFNVKYLDQYKCGST